MWFVVRTQHQREPWACENIARQGAEPYLPRIAERTKLGRKRTMVVERAKCLFPSYVFVRTEGQWRFLLGTFGVVGVLMQGGVPAVLQEQVIEELRAREDSDGLVRLPERPQARFKPGARVRVAKGAFSGYTGIYRGMAAQAREWVLLDYLGRKTPVLIGSNSLESADG